MELVGFLQLALLLGVLVSVAFLLTRIRELRRLHNS